MDRTGKISLSIVTGAAVATVVALGFSTQDSPAPKPTPKPSPERIVEQPEAEKGAAGFPNGDYVIGDDIPYGTYVSDGATTGVFELCMVTSNGSDGKHWPILKSANKGERIIIKLTKQNAGDILTVNGCMQLEKKV